MGLALTVSSTRRASMGERMWAKSAGPGSLSRTIPGRAKTVRSSSCVFGSVQVTSSGMPVVLGPDHPVTGGYPVIGVVTDEDIDKVAQIRPGQTVRLHWSRPRRPFSE